MQDNFLESVKEILKQRQSELGKELIHKSSISSDNDEFLIFRMGEKLFASNVKNVIEIIDYQSCTPLPVSKDKLIGIFSIRGEIVTAVNIKPLFELKTVNVFEESVSKFLIVQFNAIKIAVLVSEVIKKVEIAKNTIKTIDSNVNSDKYFISTIQYEKNKIVVLDLLKMIDDQIKSIK